MADKPVISVCPYCKGTDIRVYEVREELGSPVDGDLTCVDFECENCSREWTVSFVPSCYYQYKLVGSDDDEEFDPTPRPLTDLYGDANGS